MDEIRVNFDPSIPTGISQVSKIATASATEEETVDKRAVEQQAQGKKAVKEADAKELVNKINDHVKLFSTHLEFSYDIKKGRSSIKVLDKENGKVIRQIPPEEMVSLMDKMEEIAGIIFNEEA